MAGGACLKPSPIIFFLISNPGVATMARRERSTHEKTMDIIDRFIDRFYNNGTGGRYVK